MIIKKEILTEIKSRNQHHHHFHKVTKATLKSHFCYVSEFPCHKFHGNSSLNSFEFIK